jgi:hypothetical protein
VLELYYQIKKENKSMTTDVQSYKPAVKFVHDNLPSVDEQFNLVKTQLDNCNKWRGDGLTINYVDFYPNPRDVLKMGIAKDLNGYNEPYTKQHLGWDIEAIVSGLVDGILLQCKERNQTNLNVLVPTTMLEKGYLSCYAVEYNIRLVGTVKIYFS